MSFLSFDRFITPAIIQIVFVIGLVVIGLSTLVGVAGALFGYGGLLHGLFALAAAALGVLLWRVYCELIMVFFDMRTHLEKIAGR